MHNKVSTKPFIKWVGGKRSILPELVARIPKSYDSYRELFVGGGALFFEIQPSNTYLADINFQLIVTYLAIRDSVDDVIACIKKHANLHSKKYYNKIRAELNSETDSIKLAGLFIYINKTCFNGLYRVNQQGGFNVSIGSPKTVENILDEDTLRKASQVLKGVDIKQSSFEQTSIVANAFYYLDPPYHESYRFYNSNGFSDIAHEKLAQVCKKIDKQGGFFMQSNADTPLIRELYKNYIIEEVLASRSVSGTVSQRGKYSELVIRNYK